MDLRRVRAAVIVTSLSAAAGAIAGLAVAIGLDVLTSSSRHVSASSGIRVFLYIVGAAVGAILGSILGPILGFGFLRRVPLRRLLGQTTLGAAFGGILGWGVARAAPGRVDGLVMILGGSVLGLSLAALLLWRRFRADPAAIEMAG